MDIQDEVKFLLSRAPVHKVEDFEIIDIELPIENYEEIREELYNRGYDTTEVEWHDKKYLEVIKGGEKYVVITCE